MGEVIQDMLPEVTVYGGPMGAGKTTRLANIIGEYLVLRKPFAAYKPAIDIRDEGIVPKGYRAIGLESGVLKCERIDSLDDVDASGLAEAGIEDIFLDEFTMFGYDANREPIPGHYLKVMSRWKAQGIKRVFAAALDMGANCRQFPMWIDAYGNGADMQLITARCQYPVNGHDGPACFRTARNSQIYSISQDKVFRRETLPNLLPQGELSDLAYRAVCIGHLILPQSMTIDFPFSPAH